MFPGKPYLHHFIMRHLRIDGSILSLQGSKKTEPSQKSFLYIQRDYNAVIMNVFFTFATKKARRNKVQGKGKCYKRKVGTIPVSTASASFDFQCLAMFSDRGSSGFGALKSA